MARIIDLIMASEDDKRKKELRKALRSVDLKVKKYYNKKHKKAHK